MRGHTLTGAPVLWSECHRGPRLSLRAASAPVRAEAHHQRLRSNAAAGVTVSSCESSRDPHGRCFPERSAALGMTTVADRPPSGHAHSSGRGGLAQLRHTRGYREPAPSGMGYPRLGFIQCSVALKLSFSPAGGTLPVAGYWPQPMPSGCRRRIFTPAS